MKYLIFLNTHDKLLSSIICNTGWKWIFNTFQGSAATYKVWWDVLCASCWKFLTLSSSGKIENWLRFDKLEVKTWFSLFGPLCIVLN